MANVTGAPRTNGSRHDGARQDPLPNVLGWASLALGVPQTTMPGRFDESIGVKPDAESRAWTLVVGVRELAAAAGIHYLQRPRPVAWLWARVAGDAMDLALLVAAFRNKRADTGRLAAAIGAVAGIAVADVVAATRFSRKPELRMEDYMMDVKAATTVRRSRAEIYRYWHDFQNFPEFMDHLESVSANGGGRSHWTTRAPLGQSVEWDAEVTEDRENELIAWRSLDGSDVDNRGRVEFRDAPGDRGTEIHVHMQYSAPGGRVGELIAKLLGEEPTQQVKDDLRRFKQVMETGEVVRSDASPEGPTARRFVKQRPAQPLDDDGDGVAKTVRVTVGGEKV